MGKQVKVIFMRRLAAVSLVLAATACASLTNWARLPRLQATALDGSELVLPDSTATHIALVGFGYQRQSQSDIDSWLGPFRDEYTAVNLFRACEVPMMGPNIPGLLRGVINSGMRKAIPLENRHWVAPFYGDIDDYSRQLGVEDRSQVYVFLLDGSGVVRWRASGRADSSGLASLRFEVARLAAGGGE